MAPTNETLRLLHGMRVELNAAVDESVRATVRAWAQAWDEVATSWDRALADLVNAKTWPSASQISRADRAQRALELTRRRLEDLVQSVGAQITQEVTPLPRAAADWQARIIASQMPPKAGSRAELTIRFNRVDQRSLDWIVRRTTEQITSLTRPLSGEAYQAVRQSLVRGVAIGQNPREAARLMLRRIEGEFNGGLARATTIARTEMLDAHRAASNLQHLANSQTVQHWQWIAALDTRTCPSCIAQHGSIHPLTEIGPIDHQNGRCTSLPVAKSWAELGFAGIEEPASVVPDARAWFDNLPRATQAQMLGASRLDLLRSGKIGWDDLTTRRSTPGWRDSYGVTPVRDLAVRAARPQVA